MKVIINPTKQARKEYSNLPERDASRDLLRDRLARKRKLLEESSPDVAERATFGPAELIEEPKLVSEKSDEPVDFVENVLADHEAEPSPIADEEHSWKNSRWVPALFVCAVLVLGGVWYFATHFERELPLERITVEGAHLLKDQEIIALAEINRDEKFYKIDLKKIESNILRHSLIKAAYPRRETNPSTIVLHIEERQPVAMMRSQTTGDAFIIDRDGIMLRPKVLAGLKDPAKLLQVPLISGISEKDTASYRMMAKLVTTIAEIDSGALRSAVGELRRTPTGAYVIYTMETQTPIFIGSPSDAPFHTALEVQRSASTPAPEEPHFTKQLRLLARLWKKKLQNELRSGSTLYVDARFNGEVILKHKGVVPAATGSSIDPLHNPRTTAAVESADRHLLTSVTNSPGAPGPR